MTMTYEQTRELIQFVLTKPGLTARNELHAILVKRKKTEPEFCAGIAMHGPTMDLTADQWFDFFSKVWNPFYFDQPALMNKLTPVQRERLGLAE